MGNFYLHRRDCSPRPPPSFKKKFLNYPPPFLSTPPLSYPPPLSTPSLSPPLPSNVLPGLISSLASPPSPFSAPPPFLPSPLPSPTPFLYSSARALPAPLQLPGIGSLPAPLRLFGTGPLRLLASPFLPASFGQTELNKGPWPNGGPPFGLHSAKQDRTKALHSVLFDRTVPEGREVLGAGAGKPGRGIRREHVPGSGGRVLGKREETGGREAVPRRGRGWYRREDV